MLSHPGVQSVIVILLIRKNRDETRKMVGLDVPEQDVVNMNIYVTDMADNKAVWRARQEFFTGDFPCSTLVQVAGLASAEIKVEINA